MGKEGLIVVKFGGSSLANSERIKGAAIIVESNSSRRFVVVSAPGRDDSEREKVTDLLIKGQMTDVRRRFIDIGSGLNITKMNDWLGEVESGAKANDSEWLKSRGEWLMAKVFAQFLGGSFVDAQELIKLRENDEIDPFTYTTIREQLSEDTVYVIPGFYGQNKDTGAIRCFARGGSDITGAIIAKGVGARLYENWTDVDGIRSADPRIIPDAKGIAQITYDEIRELGYRGTEVLQMDSVIPALQARIPINVRNSFNPDHPGTAIVEQRFSAQEEQIIGLASRKDLVSFQITISGMNKRVGVSAHISRIFAEHGVSFEHNPTGIDTMSVICHTDQLPDGREQGIMNQIYQELNPDSLTLVEDMGLVSIVGQRIKTQPTEVQAKLYTALSNAHIKTDSGMHSTQGVSTVISVSNSDVEHTLEVLYNTFIR